MSRQKDREEFTARVTRAFPALAPHLAAELARKLMRLAATADRLAVEGCNGPNGVERMDGKRIEQWENDLAKRDERAEARIQKLCAEHGIEVETSGDPRGYVVKIKLTGQHGNTMGGEGWIGVPS